MDTTKKKFSRRFFWVLLLFFATPTFGQSPAGQSPVLEAYLKQGLASNLGIQQQKLLLDKSLYALKEANGLFLPQVSLGGSYSLAAGGRRIDLPIGDLLNPIYSTLNQMTQSDRFPQVQNVSEQFLPNNFYDVRLRATQPIYNAEIQYNRQVKRELTGLQQIEVQVYKRELVKEIKKAYFQYLQATEAVKIYANALALLGESKRVNESLVRNGAANGTVLARTEGELTKVRAQAAEAQNNRLNAAAYFNFLLNQPLEAPVTADSLLMHDQLALPTAPDTAMGRREELQKLGLVKNLNQLSVKLGRAAFLPKVGTQLDLGSQAFRWQFDDQSRYALLGLSFEWSLFAGQRNINKIRQAERDLSATETQYAQAEQQLRLQLRTALNSYQSAWGVFESTAPQVSAARRYYGDIEKRYRAGQASYIEYLDARTELTNAQLQRSLARYQAWAKLAEVERAQASYNLDQ
jgi:outer membrane protein TolC